MPVHSEIQILAKEKSLLLFGQILTEKLESVLIRGEFNGLKRYRGIKLGTVDIDWVYNSMPPNAGQIYPQTDLNPSL